MKLRSWTSPLCKTELSQVFRIKRFRALVLQIANLIMKQILVLIVHVGIFVKRLSAFCRFLDKFLKRVFRRFDLVSNSVVFGFPFFLNIPGKSNLISGKYREVFTHQTMI